MSEPANDPVSEEEVSPPVETPKEESPIVEKPRRGRPPKHLATPKPPPGVTEDHVKSLLSSFKEELERDRLKRKAEKERVEKLIRKYRDEPRYPPPLERYVPPEPKRASPPPPPVFKLDEELKRPEPTPVQQRKQFYKQKIFY